VDRPTKAEDFEGVNVAGFDFGVDINGTALLASSQGPLTALGGSDGAGQMTHFFNDDALNLFRLPVSWQFLINNNITLDGGNGTNGSADANAAGNTLDDVNFGNYDQLVQACLATGAHCIVDVHNYARFNGLIIGQGGPSNDQFASLWSQIATKYANETNIIFGVMNEPHNIPDISIWAQSVQAAVTAIRNAGATTQMILLPGNDFTGAQTFISNGSAGNLSLVRNPDGTNTSLIFDVHKYLDVDGSGTHLECVQNHIVDTFVPLTAYLKANGRQAMLTETGGGNSSSCLIDLCQELMFINANDDIYLGYAGWSAGGFGTTYNLTLTPISNANGTFTDVPLLSECVVGTRQAGGIASRNERAIRQE